MIDLDGRYEYSDIISVSTKRSDNLRVAPNPILQDQIFQLSGNFEKSDRLTIRMFTLTGILVGTQKYQANGNQQITVQAADFDLTKGQYVLQITDNKGVHRTSLVQVQ